MHVAYLSIDRYISENGRGDKKANNEWSLMTQIVTPSFSDFNWSRQMHYSVFDWCARGFMAPLPVLMAPTRLHCFSLTRWCIVEIFPRSREFLEMLNAN